MPRAIAVGYRSRAFGVCLRRLHSWSITVESLAVPLIAATVFTVGGYAITRAGRAAEAVGDWLFTVFIATVLVGAAVLANQALERRRPAPQAGHGSAVQHRAAMPPGQAWAQHDLPAY